MQYCPMELNWRNTVNNEAVVKKCVQSQDWKIVLQQDTQDDSLTRKTTRFLLDIFKDIARKNDKAVLLLFGVGELVEPMKEKAKRLGIQERVIFYGASSEMEKMYQARMFF